FTFRPQGAPRGLSFAKFSRSPRASAPVPGWRACPRRAAKRWTTNDEHIMSQPATFTWVDQPLLAAMARPESADELAWLRQQGIQVVLSLTVDPLRRDWVNDAGLMAVHVPVVDMESPTQEQLEKCLSIIERAHQHQMPVLVHCSAGLGRTGVILACYFVAK